MPPGPKRVPAGTKKKHRFVANAPRGTLTVTVKDGKGAAVSGAAVQVEQPGGRLLKGQTTAAGTVDFPSVVAGQSKVTVQKDGFKQGAATVQVPAAAAVGANAVLQPATETLVVRVIDSVGAALTGADVTVETPAHAKLSQKTDAKGQATFKDLLVGTHQVSAKLDNYTGPAAKAVQVALKGKNTALVTLKPNPVVAQITPTPLVVVLPKRGCNPARKQITLKITGPAFTGNGTFTCSKPNLAFFNAAAGGSPITFKNGDNVFTGAALAAGVNLFAQGTGTPSTALKDAKLTLALSVGTNAFGTAGTAKATVVELTLELFQSRRKAAGDPAPMSANDKIDVGRFVHEQDPGFHHGRAMLVVREVKPATFKDPLVLQPIPAPPMAPARGAAQLFARENRPSGGDAALATPIVVTHAKLTKDKVAGDKGLAFFIEGQTPSNALRDTGFQLGIQGDEQDGDRAVVTVVRLSNLTATIPSTDAQTNRTAAGFTNSPVPASTISRGTAAALAAADFDEDYSVNAPLVLIENSVAAAHPIALSVQVKPAGVPLRWSPLRDTRPQVAGHPNTSGDVKRVRDVSPKPLPQLQQVVGNPLRATLLTDAVGSFHIRAYVDCNGSLDFDRDATATLSFSAEPYILLNVVFVRAQGFNNTSVVQPGNMSARRLGSAFVPGGGVPPTGNVGVRIDAGNFVSGATAGVHSQAQVDVIGGGDGTRGLDRVFAGWANNVQATPGSLSAPAGLDIDADYLQTLPAPVMGPAPPPVTHHFFIIFVSAGAGTTFGPPPAAAPNVLPMPILDVTNFGNEGMGGNLCIGTEGAVGPPGGITKVPIPASAGLAHPAGQRWTINMFDSPGFGVGPTHPFGTAAGQPFFPTNLVQFRFNLNFRCDLVFWTNIQGPPFVPAPTPGPVSTPLSAAPDPACCLYASVQTNQWTIRYQANFSPIAPFAQTGGVAPTMGITLDPQPKRTALPATIEARFPAALNVLALNART